jgi:hypothetical protein
MKPIIASIFALALLGAATASAQDVGVGVHVGGAGVSVGVDFGDVAFAYEDGYWDSHHRWHKWRHKHDRERYMAMSGNHYNDWKHDRDPDKGWHESDHGDHGDHHDDSGHH